jgi:hypothetical protein
MQRVGLYHDIAYADWWHHFYFALTLDEVWQANIRTCLGTAGPCAL